MSEHPPVIEQADLMLARLAALDLRAAEHANACLLDTTKPAEVADLARAYARLSRCLRQTLAIHARLKADREKAARMAEQHQAWQRAVTPEPDLRELALADRTVEVQHAVDRVISAAADGDKKLHTDWVHRFDREVDDWTETEDWLEDDVDAIVQRVCRTLGLPEDYAARWRELPDPTFIPDPEEETPEELAAASAACRELTAQLRDGIKPKLSPPWDKHESSG
jgi:hypothetical protein